MARIYAIGQPSTFRQQVAVAASTSPESVGWMPDASSLETILGPSESADVLVVSPEMDHEDVLALVQMAARFSPTTAIVVLRQGHPNGAVSSYMRAGARDVVDVDAGANELQEALSRAVSWSSRLSNARTVDASPGGSLVSVFSSKGGTGKTFIATNLAIAISETTGQETALVDLDLAMGDVFSYWGKEPTHPIQDLLALGHMADRESVLGLGTQLTERLWGFGAPADPAAESIPSESIAALLAAVRSTFSHTVVDGAAGYTDQLLPALDASDFVCLVAGLDVVGVKHLSTALETLSSIGIPREKLVVVLNRADSKVGIDVDDVERVLGLKIDSSIPSSRSVPISLNRGEPILLGEPGSDVAAAIRALAVRVATGSTNKQEETAAAAAHKQSLIRGLFKRA